MEKINNLLRLKKFKRVRNEDVAIRADWINQCAQLVGRPYFQLSSIFKGYPTSFIKDLYEKASSWKTNPPAYFWKLWKENK